MSYSYISKAHTDLTNQFIVNLWNWIQSSFLFNSRHNFAWSLPTYHKLFSSFFTKSSSLLSYLRLWTQSSKHFHATFTIFSSTFVINCGVTGLLRWSSLYRLNLVSLKKQWTIFRASSLHTSTLSVRVLSTNYSPSHKPTFCSRASNHQVVSLHYY